MPKAALKPQIQARHPLYQAALDADEKFSRELVRVYGKSAHLARYWPDLKHTDPALLSTKRDKVAADEAWFDYTRRSRREA